VSIEIISRLRISGKKIAIYTLLAGVLAAAPLSLGQTASAYLSQAEEGVATGDFPAAIEAYQKAIAATANSARRDEIEETLEQLTKRFFADLYNQALQSASREEKIRLLVEAGSLEIRDWIGTDFGETLRASQRLINEVFEELRLEAESATGEGNYPRAISLYDQARGLDPAAFERRGFQPVYQGLLEQIQEGIELVRQGDELFSAGRYQEAVDKFLEVDALYPGIDGVQEGLSRADSMLSVQDSKGYAQANQLIRAERALKEALGMDQNNDEAARLLNRSQDYRKNIHQARTLYGEDSCRESQQAFREARTLDRPRFQENEDSSLLSGDCASPLPLPEGEIRDALLDLFDGRIQDSTANLERLLEEMGESHLQVPAILGIAYGYAALMNPEVDTATLENAKQQFRTVLRSQPDYQFSDRLFSPRILQVVEEIRSEITGQ
jgi:tetratricopeptide (TPR) repeat protein